MLAQQLADHAGADLLDRAGRQGPQLERSVGQPDQPVDGQADRFQHLADFAVLALGDLDADPQVGGLRAVLLGGGLVDGRLDRAVAHAVDGDPVLQPVELGLGDASPRPRPVLTHQRGLRQLESARQLAVVGQQQQAFGVDVQTPDRDHPRQAAGQGVEHRRPPLRIIVRGQQADRLVVAPDPRGLGRRDRLAVHGDDVVARHQGRRRVKDAAVHRHLAQADQPLDLATRGDARARHGLGDPLATLRFGRRGILARLAPRLAAGARALGLRFRACALVRRIGASAARAPAAFRGLGAGLEQGG